MKDPIAVSYQCAKKVVSDSAGPVDFATGLVNSIFNLPDRQEKLFLGLHCSQSCSSEKKISGYIKSLLG